MENHGNYIEMKNDSLITNLIDYETNNINVYHCLCWDYYPC